MKLRLDLLDHLKDEDILGEVLANYHRYKPEPLFSKTGTGSLSATSIKDRALEHKLSMAITQKLMPKPARTGKRPDRKS